MEIVDIIFYIFGLERYVCYLKMFQMLQLRSFLPTEFKNKLQ